MDRFGGDEFVVLRTDLTSQAATEAAAAAVARRVSGPFSFEGVVVVPHASVGAAWTDVRTGADPLVARADADM